MAICGCGVVASLHTACSPSSELAARANADRGPLYYLSLADVARLIEAGEVSPVELTRMMLDRIDTLDARLHSYATVMAGHALAAARLAEREIQSGRYRGPLHGVPIAVKDLCYTRGVPTMGGLKVLSDFVPDFDATVVSKLEAAGAVLLGKLNTTEGAMVGYHRDFAIPVNPWGKELWAGVSSSGSGVATAAGLCFASLGTDTGGSIRFPAMANGIVGLKPTYGRVSRFGVLPLAESLDHVGPMTRSVADAAIVFEAIAGSDPRDPTSLEVPVPGMLDELGGGLQGVRIGFDRAYALDGVDPGLASAIEAAVGELEHLGAEVVDVQVPDLTEVLAAWPVLCAAEAVEAHRENYPARADEYGAYFREFLDFGSSLGEAELANARRVRMEFGDQFRAVLSGVDAVASPAAGAPIEVEAGLQYGSMTQWNQARARIFQSLGLEKANTSFTFPHNFAGTPALAFPCGFSERNLPYTMQLAGEPLSEAMLCRIGFAYEQATPWHRRHPPV
jgi:amidase